MTGSPSGSMVATNALRDGSTFWAANDAKVQDKSATRDATVRIRYVFPCEFIGSVSD